MTLIYLLYVAKYMFIHSFGLPIANFLSNRPTSFIVLPIYCTPDMLQPASMFQGVFLTLFQYPRCNMNPHKGFWLPPYPGHRSKQITIVEAGMNFFLLASN